MPTEEDHTDMQCKCCVAVDVRTAVTVAICASP